MMTNSAQTNGVTAEPVLRDCRATLERVASYRLPPALDRRFLLLSENKGRLTEAETSELYELVEFAEGRTVEKLQARLVLQQLDELWPPENPSR